MTFESCQKFQVKNIGQKSFHFTNSVIKTCLHLPSNFSSKYFVALAIKMPDRARKQKNFMFAWFFRIDDTDYRMPAHPT